MKKNLKIVIGVIILIILSLIIFTDKSNKTFNDINFNNNKIVNQSNIMGADTIVAAGLNELAINNVNVLIRPFPPGFKSDLNYQAYINRITLNIYVIHIKRNSRRESIKILAHELIHLQQMHDNILAKEGNTIYWGIMIYRMDQLPEYLERPWEIDAFNKQFNLDSKIRTKLYKN